MSDKYSTITFCKTDYTERGEFNAREMWDDISDFMRIAVRNGYHMKVSFDGLTVIVQYNLQNEGISGVSLEWLGDDEYVAKEGEELHALSMDGDDTVIKPERGECRGLGDGCAISAGDYIPSEKFASKCEYYEEARAGNDTLGFCYAQRMRPTTLCHGNLCACECARYPDPKEA